MVGPGLGEDQRELDSPRMTTSCWQAKSRSLAETAFYRLFVWMGRGLRRTGGSWKPTRVPFGRLRAELPYQRKYWLPMLRTAGRSGSQYHSGWPTSGSCAVSAAPGSCT